MKVLLLALLFALVSFCAANTGVVNIDACTFTWKEYTWDLSALRKTSTQTNWAIKDDWFTYNWNYCANTNLAGFTRCKSIDNVCFKTDSEIIINSLKHFYMYSKFSTPF